MAKFSIQYRQLKTDGMGTDPNLKSMLVKAMRENIQDAQVGLSAKARIIDLDQDESFVILNKITDQAHWDGQIFCGQIIHLQQNADIAGVLQSLEEDTDEYLLQQVNIGEDARVLRGVLYFAVVDNHVGIVEGHQVKGRILERYLTSLFQRVGILRAAQAVILNGKFLSGDGKELKETTEVTIQAKENFNPDFGLVEEAVDRVVDDGVARVPGREGSTVFDVLRLLGWDNLAIESLSSEIPVGGWIEGAFKFFIKDKGSRKKISRATINEALRNIDPADMGLSGDGKERGGIVKLSTTRQFKMIGSLKDPADAMEQIVNALKEWALAGKIDCTFEA